MDRERRTEINCSSASLLSLLIFPMEAWVKISRSLGYDGLEWRPKRSLADAQIRSGLISPYGIAGIRSAEQSYLGERSWEEASSQSNKRLAQVSYLLFPHRVDSIDTLNRLQSLKGEIPITVYPTDNPEELEAQRTLRNKLVQLAPDCMRIWKSHSLEQLVIQMSDEGYGINFDILHYLRLAQKFKLPPNAEAIKLMLPYIKEIQFPVGRTDIQLPNSDSMGTYHDLVNRTAQSSETQLFIQLMEMGCEAPVVAEVNPAKLAPFGLFKAHRKISRGLKALIS